MLVSPMSVLMLLVRKLAARGAQCEWVFERIIAISTCLMLLIVLTRDATVVVEIYIHEYMYAQFRASHIMCDYVMCIAPGS